MLISGTKLIGLRQSSKAVRAGKTKLAFIAKNAGQDVIVPFAALCSDCGVAIEYAESCAELGKACGISVGCAAAVILK